MTPHEALALVDNACAMLNVNRQTHAQLVAAVRTLAELVGADPSTNGQHEPAEVPAD